MTPPNLSDLETRLYFRAVCTVFCRWVGPRGGCGTWGRALGVRRRGQRKAAGHRGRYRFDLSGKWKRSKTAPLRGTDTRPPVPFSAV